MLVSRVSPRFIFIILYTVVVGDIRHMPKGSVLGVSCTKRDSCRIAVWLCVPESKKLMGSRANIRSRFCPRRMMS